MRTFLHHGDPLTMKQVLSLGAGFDTSFFRLSKGECIHNSVKYFEVHDGGSRNCSDVRIPRLIFHVLFALKLSGF